MQLPIYQIDAFAECAFEGNPAAVVPLQEWLADATLQAIAEENNLAETAFTVPTEQGFHIRWFTPTAEVKLCGHATLAAAYVLFEYCDYPGEQIVFDSQSGPLLVTRPLGSEQDRAELCLDFPAQPATACDTPAALVDALGAAPQYCLQGDAYVAVYANEADVAAIAPNMPALTALDRDMVIVTAPGTEQDFVARFFAPRLGIPEDPVTGSAYTVLAPYWAERLAKTTLAARQISRRGGNVRCELRGERVFISGSVIAYLEGRITV